MRLLEIARRYDTDKGDHPHYLSNYEAMLPPAGAKIALLELGIWRGGSLQMWRDFYQTGTIVGLDQAQSTVPDDTGRIRVYQGGQEDLALLDRIRSETAPDGFDTIIDDASHIGYYTRTSFWHLFEHHLKPGGLYVIEDWATGYWRDWPDGKLHDDPQPLVDSRFCMLSRIASDHRLARVPWLARLMHRVADTWMPRRFPSHDAGMVGFIKQLVDEICVEEMTHPDRGRPPQRPSRISQLQFTPGQVFVRKPAQPRY